MQILQYILLHILWQIEIPHQMSLLCFILYRIYCPQWFYQHFAAHICPNMFNIFVLWNLLHPIIDIFERFPVGNIINHHNSVSSFIVGWCYGSKTVLACSVPLNINIDSYYLHSYFLSIYFCTFHFLRVKQWCTKSTPTVL